MRVKKLFIIASSLLLLLAGCFVVRSNHNSAIKFYDSSLKDALADFDQEITKKRSSLSLILNQNSVAVSNCAQFLDMLNQGAEYSEDVSDQLYLSEYQICLILKAFLNAEQAKKSYFSKSNIGKLIYDSFDVRNLRSSLNARITDDEKPFTLSQFEFKNVKIMSNLIEIETTDWYYVFSVLASGDFNQDGFEDIIVRFEDDAKFGTYFNISTLIFERKESKGVITSTELDKIVKNMP